MCVYLFDASHSLTAKSPPSVLPPLSHCCLFLLLFHSPGLQFLHHFSSNYPSIIVITAFFCSCSLLSAFSCLPWHSFLFVTVTFSLALLLWFTLPFSTPSSPSHCSVSVQGPHQRFLLRELLRDYNPMERPVANDSQALTVQFSFTLMQVMDVVRLAQTHHIQNYTPIQNIYTRHISPPKAFPM